MDLLDRLLGHDAWTTRQLLLCCKDLPDAQLDLDFDLGFRTVRKTFLHIVRNMEVWSDLMANVPVRADGDASVAGLTARLDRAAADLAAIARAVAERGGWDERFVDHLDRQPTEKTLGGGIAHVVTHSMHHRAQLHHMLRRLGVVGLPEGDVLGWERQAKEAYGPPGDPSHHRPLAQLEAAFRALPPAQKNTGRLALIVRRRADGTRETPERVTLTPEEGLPGDRWGRRAEGKLPAQLTVVRRDVIELIANGQPLTVSGDNLVVDLDISAVNLPKGARLRVGKAVVEVSAKPHNGCSKFAGRFGADALALVKEPRTRDLNLRGVYWTVVEKGEVRVGDPIIVLSRG
ncbi:MAG: DinB family protein [Planctomycetota bacterium]